MKGYYFTISLTCMKESVMLRRFIIVKMSLTLFAAGLLTATVLFAPCTPSVAQERSANSTDFSAQQQQEKKAQRKKAAPAQRAAPQSAAPRVVTPKGTRTVTAARLRGVPARGAGRAVIRGQNYSAWRSGYRARHG